MNKTAIKVSAMVISMALFSVHAYAADDSIRVAGLDVTPSVKLIEKYKDNIFNQETVKNSSWITIIDPSFLIKAGKGISQVGVTYRLSKGIYDSSSGDNYLDHFAGLAADFDLSSKLQAGLAVDYSKTHDPRGSTFTGSPVSFKTPDKYHETVVSGKIGYGVNAHVDLTGEYSNKRYENHHTVTKVRDFDTTGGGVAFSYSIGPSTRAVVEARYKSFNYVTATLDSVEQRYFAGVDWEATAKTSGTLRFGYLKKAFSNSVKRDGSQFSWELNALWEPATYSSFSLNANSKPQESDGIGSFTKVTGSRLTWNYAWNSNVSHVAYMGYSNTKYQDVINQRTDNTTAGGASVTYQLKRWLGVEGAYDYTNRNSNATNSSYVGNIWMLSLVGTL